MVRLRVIALRTPEGMDTLENYFQKYIIIKMASQVIDLRASKGMTRGQSNEHLRVFSQRAFEEKRAHNFDPTREHLNFEVLPGGVIAPLNKKDPIDNRIRRSLKARGIEDPNEGLSEDSTKRRRTIIDIIFQGSRNRMRELAFGNQKIEENGGILTPDNSKVIRQPEIEEWALDIYNFACKKFGKENIAAFVCHLDEKNPHIHCTVIPVGTIKGKEKISFNAVMGGDKHESRQRFKDLHDELAQVNEKWGLVRGQDIYVTGARHRTTEEYWKWLTDRCSELEEKKSGIEEEIKLLKLERNKTNKAIKGLNTMIGNLQDEISRLTNEIADKEADLADYSVEEKSALSQIEEKRQNLDELQKKLQEKKMKLNDAVQRYELLQQKILESYTRYTEVETHIKELTPGAQREAINLAESIGWNVALNEIRKARESLSEIENGLEAEEREGFKKCEESIFGANYLLKNMEESGAEIVAVAANLFLGYLDDATSFTQSAGGGGGGQTGGWGRKKDEDDRDFMGRCFIMACSMMKPSRSRRKKK